MDERMREYLEGRGQRRRWFWREGWIALAAGCVIAVVCFLPWLVFDLPLWAGVLIGFAIATALRPIYGRFADWRGWSKS